MLKAFQCIMTILSIIVILLLFVGVTIFVADKLRDIREEGRFSTEYPAVIELEEEEYEEDGFLYRQTQTFHSMIESIKQKISECFESA